ncbi:hypothetical protein G7067_04405 [Leucobacter insecticola]|uniref:Uncharacterized protein n=1 Tax=Leucobacter insecticola TaxID=2714934 RepID=A0A6G8FHI5_9MICO|nr:hypothetical protein [Leucobacter insecticola]QIM15825.1 hypothetical protein G7067_04405 [Leucobacter insecticola]
MGEFFDGNVDEESLAPNQWGNRGPTLVDIAARLRLLSQDADVVWVRVGLHPDVELDEPDGDVAAEAILITTTAPAADLEDRINVTWLCSDGIFESDDSSLLDYCEVPEISGNERIVFLLWD